MNKLAECIPNFSEGRDRGLIEALAAEARRVPGVTLLDYSSDPNHHRSVFTLVGDPDNLAEAAFRLCRLAAEKIDLSRHQGAHPRLGATDVIPFIPVRGLSLEDCVELSRRVAERIARELEIPVYLYEASARADHRRNLADIRRGQFEGLSQKMLTGEWAPDYGPRRPHPTAGATVVGARQALIAFNINLGSSDLALAEAIARAVRGASGGFANCRALGVRLEERGQVQVSMNLTDYRQTPVYRVFEAVRAEAARRGAPIVGAELIGLAPARALIDCAEYYLKLEDFDFERQVLENHLLK